MKRGKKKEREVKEKKKKKREIIKKVVTKTFSYRFSLSFGKRCKHDFLQNMLEKHLGINYFKQ